jgi:hypothetical protein
MAGVPPLLKYLAHESCPAFGPDACCPWGAVCNSSTHPAYASESFFKLQKKTVIDYDSEVFPFGRYFREALLSEAEKMPHKYSRDTGQEFRDKTRFEARLQKKEMSYAAVSDFQQRLRDLPLSLIHLAVDPHCYTGAGAGSIGPGGGEAEPHLKLPKGNINRFFMRRLRPLYNKFICEVIAGNVAAAMAPFECSSVFFQTSPCLRMNPPSATRATHPHIDAMYYHQPGQINFWLPLTDAYGNNSLWVESAPFSLDHAPLVLRGEGQIARFYGNRCIHFTVPNDTPHTRITLDFRAVPGILFDNDSKLSRDKFGGQMFSNGGYYSECRFDKAQGKWTIIGKPKELGGP